MLQISHFALAATLSLSLTAAFAQQFPTHPIRVIVPYPAGQGADLVARRLVAKVGPILGQPMVIENRGGAGGNIGTDVAAKAKPDGYTLVLGTSATHAANEFLYEKMSFDAANDFTPIVAAVSYGMILAVPTTSPYKTLADLVAAARSKPKSLEVALPSTTARLVLELFHTASNAQILAVPYVGSPPALVDSISGRVAMIIDTSSALMGSIKGGTLRPLAMATEKRMDSYPNVPTFKEQGFEVIQPPANGLFAPKGTPAQVVQIINAAVNKAFADRELFDAFVADGAQPIGGTPEELDRMMRTERQKWERIVKATGMKAQ